VAAPDKPAPAKKEKDKDRARLEEEIRALRVQLQQAQLEALAQRDRMRVQLKQALLEAVEADQQLERALQGRAEAERALRRARQEAVCVLKAVDAGKRTVSLALGGTKLVLEAVPVSKGAKLSLGARECALGDLKAGMTASVGVADEGGRGVVVAIRAEQGKKE
jgi:hypothetical protein